MGTPAAAHASTVPTRLRAVLIALRSWLIMCLIAVLVLAPVSTSAFEQGHDKQTINTASSEPSPEHALLCDEGLLCSAYLVLEHAAAVRIEFATMPLAPSGEQLAHDLAGPAIDLPPPRRAA